jgi:hypothetical protein
MIPTKLSRLLIGRTIDCYHHGQRCGVVLAARGQVLAVKFLAPYGRRRLSVSAVVGVHWRGKKRTLEEYLQLRSAAKLAKGEARAVAR